jgi:hypothetical protein
MKLRRLSAACLALGALALGTALPAQAQDAAAPVVKATDAKGLLKVLQAAGYKAKFEELENPEDKPSIEITTREGPVYVVFSDCEEAVPDFCETLVLSTSWDRDTPISDKVITESNYNFKYVSIWRDETGDPVAQWAILTGDIGVPQPLFLNALQRYLDIVRDFGEIAFADDEAPKLDKTTAAVTGGAGTGTAK